MLLKLIGHPLCSIFPTTLVNNVVSHSKMVMLCVQMIHAISFMQKWQFHRAGNASMPFLVLKCGYELGHMKNLAFSKKKWVPYKTFHFVPPSSVLDTFYVIVVYVSF